jgi:uncharacterized Zn-finger protein
VFQGQLISVSDLKKHVEMAHLKLGPYVCEYCKMGFSGLHAMKTHRRRHTNKKPYRCEVRVSNKTCP